jgi:hypothetical protein
VIPVTGSPSFRAHNGPARHGPAAEGAAGLIMASAACPAKLGPVRHWEIIMTDLLANAHVVMDSGRTRPIQVRGAFALPTARTVSQQVGKFLVENAAELAVPFSAAEMKLVKEAEVAGRKILRYDHCLEGIRVFGAQTIVTVDTSNRLSQVDLYPGPTRAVRLRTDSPLLDSKAATKAAAAAIGPHTPRAKPPAPAPEPIWFPFQGTVVRSILVLIPTVNPAHLWQIVVEANSGRILDKRDLIKEMPDGTGMVFDPNPVVSAMNSTFRDPAATTGSCGFAGTPVATLDAQRVSRTLQGLTMSGGNFTLTGPWCQILDSAAPTVTVPAEASGNFNYSCTNPSFNAVMIYYHIDEFQRYLQSIGITNARASVIPCDPLDNSINAAWYAPPSGGGDGGLHFSNSGNCQPDRATDADVMLHEYHHAIQDDIVPAWGSSNNPITGRNEAGAMGEGAGDFIACAYFADRNGGFQREVFEDWVFAPSGLRRVDGTKVYPTNWTGSVHSDGEIWSAALWNTYRAIGGDAGGAGALTAHENARQAMFRSLIGSYPLLAVNASMPDGAEAVMRTNAALPQYRGAHLREMLQSFHDRGILKVDAGADLFVRDDPVDPGTTAYQAPVFWDSPDLWIRNNDDNGTVHQNPKAGSDNYLYARVTNRGTASARGFAVTFNVKQWLGTQFMFPGDFVPFISAAPGFNLAAGASMVVKAKWPAALVPGAGFHGCILASVFTPLESIPVGAHVWQHPNLGQKNIDVVAADAGDTVSLRLRIGNAAFAAAQRTTLEIRNPTRLAVGLRGDPRILGQILEGGDRFAIAERQPVREAPSLPIRIIDAARVAISGGARPVTLNLAAGSTISLDGARGDEEHGAAMALAPTRLEALRTAAGALQGIGLGEQLLAQMPLLLPARTDTEILVEARVPKTARSGETHVVDVVQRDSTGRAVGGVRLRIEVR